MVRNSRIFCLLAVLVFLISPAHTASASPSNGDGHLAIVLAQNGSQVVAGHGLDLVEEHPFQDGSILVVRMGPNQSITSLRQSLSGDSNVLAVDEDFLSSLSPEGLRDADRRHVDLMNSSDSAGTLHTACLDQYFGDGAWAGWAAQSAASLTMIRDAQTAAGHCGEGVTVAIIDTGVDSEHPLLKDAVAPGYDFLADTPATNSEWSGLGGSMSAIVENSLRAAATGSMSAIVEQSTRRIAEDSYAGVAGSMSCIVEADSISVLLAQEYSDTFDDLDLPPLFGHGTMVAGLIRLVAPGAQILPLRAFDGNGVGTSLDIVSAIYYAVDQGADVINMSFSMVRQSSAVAEALRYARQHGVVVVAAAGNRSSNAPTYPASDSKVIGVASSDDFDVLADFSNYGPNNADLVAPGIALISSYPGGHYAAGWGTSFSTPLVAGAAALLRFGRPDDATTQRETVEHILNGVDDVGLQGRVLTGGRLDIYRAILESFN